MVLHNVLLFVVSEQKHDECAVKTICLNDIHEDKSSTTYIYTKISSVR